MMDFWYRPWWINHAGDLMVPPDPVRPIRKRSKMKPQPCTLPARLGGVWVWSADLNHTDGRPIVMFPVGRVRFGGGYWVDHAAEYQPLVPLRSDVVI